MDSDLEHQMTTDQSQDPKYIAAHRAAFQCTDAPTTLTVGNLVWIIDHYYPGVVERFDDRGRAVIRTWWDADETDELAYTPKEYKQLRVDTTEATREFWPAPKGWERVEA